MLGFIGMEYLSLGAKLRSVCRTIRTHQTRYKLSSFLQIVIVLDYYYSRLHLDCLRINFVVLWVRTKPPDFHDMFHIIHLTNQPIVVTLDIEYDAPSLQDTSLGMAALISGGVDHIAPCARVFHARYDALAALIPLSLACSVK